jgi:fatty acid desaturase
MPHQTQDRSTLSIPHLRDSVNGRVVAPGDALYAAFKKRGLATYSAASGVAVFGLTAWSSLSGDFVPLWVALVLGLGWASAVAARLMTDSDEAKG